jgi:DNA-binding NarL/FixJ family response regulator
MHPLLVLPIITGSEIMVVRGPDMVNASFRVLVANQPRLMRESLVEVLAEEPWVEIVGEVAHEKEIPEAVHRTAPDLLVVTAENPGERPALCDELLREHPALRIIAVAPHENYTVCYWASLDIHSDHIESSEQGFLRAVKSVAETVSRVGQAK